MIHLIIREATPYQLVLCRTLNKGYGGRFVAWFGSEPKRDLPYVRVDRDEFQKQYLNRSGYGQLLRALWRDPEAVILLGGWSSPMTTRTLLLAWLLRRPIFIWLDHPHPRKRNALFNALRNAYIKLLGKTVSGFLACGQITVDHLAAIGLTHRNIVVFPYWVDIPAKFEMPERVRATKSTRPLRLLAVGRHVPVKRFDTAIRAIAVVNNSAKDSTAELVLVGDGTERDSLERLSAELGCRDVVHFTGWLNNDAVAHEIQKSDALVLTSSFEGYGVIVLEAMAAGRVILASDGVTAARDRDDGSGAIMFHPVGNAKHLATQVQELAGNSNLLQSACASARAIAESWPPERAVTILNDVLRNTYRGRRLLASCQALPSFVGKQGLIEHANY